MSHGARRIRRLLLFAAGAAVVVLLLAQLILPRVAASRISSRVGRYGSVSSVSVSAWPAIELLWGHAAAVHVRAARLALTPQQVTKLLWEARGVERVEIAAEDVKVGSLQLSDATLQKRGSALSASALASEADVHAALPAGLEVRLLASEHGQVEVRANGALFGVSASVDAVALASEGKLIAHPLGLLIEGLKLTLFADPHVAVSGVGASVASGQPGSYRLAMTGVLH
jgi:DUF2993 family protein